MSDRLNKLLLQVDVSVPDDTILQWLQSTVGDRRLMALLTIRKKVEAEFLPPDSYYNIAVAHLIDNDNDCRWQAFIIAARYMETKPEECWELIIKHGNSNDQDTRAAVATILLEHYFEKNPGLFDIKFRNYKQLIKSGQNNLLKTLSICYSDWGGESNQIKVNRFIENNKGS